MKNFNTTNEIIKLSVMVQGFDGTLEELKSALTEAQTVTAIKLGCQVLYNKLSGLASSKDQKAAVAEVRKTWRDSNSGKLIPKYFEDQLKSASE